MLTRLLAAARGGGAITIPMSTTYHGFLAYASSGQSVGDRLITPLNMDTDDHDTDAIHFTSASALTGTIAATGGSATITGTGTSFTTELSDNQVFSVRRTLTGTVSKTAGSTTITGSGTSFTSQLEVGDIISIPGTQTETLPVLSIASNTSLTVRVGAVNSASGQTATGDHHLAVASIASDTSLTVHQAPANSVSGATGTRRNYAACVPIAGYWDFYGYWYTGTNVAQDVPAHLWVNGVLEPGAQFTPWTTQPNNVGGVGQVRLLPRHFDVGDIVWMSVYWDNNGGAGGTIGGSSPFTESVFGGHLIGT